MDNIESYYLPIILYGDNVNWGNYEIRQDIVEDIRNKIAEKINRDPNDVYIINMAYKEEAIKVFKDVFNNKVYEYGKNRENFKSMFEENRDKPIDMTMRFIPIYLKTYNKVDKNNENTVSIYNISFDKDFIKFIEMKFLQNFNKLYIKNIIVSLKVIEIERIPLFINMITKYYNNSFLIEDIKKELRKQENLIKDLKALNGVKILIIYLKKQIFVVELNDKNNINGDNKVTFNEKEINKLLLLCAINKGIILIKQKLDIEHKNKCSYNLYGILFKNNMIEYTDVSITKEIYQNLNGLIDNREKESVRYLSLSHKGQKA